MNVLTRFEQFYDEAKGNRWFLYFSFFCRIALAWSFLPSGIVKIMGERFTGLPSNHPLGHYFDALALTGFYYTFIGVAQVTTAFLLLIPRTAYLGAMMYFPIILNICVLTFATGFDGSKLTCLMIWADLFLLCGNYDRLKYILPFHPSQAVIPKTKALSSKFPFAFFGGVVATVGLTLLLSWNFYELWPGHTITDCRNQCEDSSNPLACEAYCDCIHNQGKTLKTCLDAYNLAKESR